jgi:hypothetical protein
MCPCAGYDDAESELKKVPRVIPTNEKAYREYAEAKRWERARETIAGHRGVLPSQVTNDQIAKYLANQERFERHRLEREERERQGEKPIYGPGGEHSFSETWWRTRWRARARAKSLTRPSETRATKLSPACCRPLPMLVTSLMSASVLPRSALPTRTLA